MKVVRRIHYWVGLNNKTKGNENTSRLIERVDKKVYKIEQWLMVEIKTEGVDTINNLKTSSIF